MSGEPPDRPEAGDLHARTAEDAHRYPGRLFVVEGIDGSGKWTQLELLAKWLAAAGERVFVTELRRPPREGNHPRAQGRLHRAGRPLHLHRLRAGFWESGMDLKLGDDIYDSFRTYQTKLLREYATLATEFNFRVLDARLPIDRIQEDLRAQIGAFLDSEAAARPQRADADASARVAP